MKALCGVVMLSVFCAFVQAAEDCQHAVFSGDKVYRQFDLGTEFACLYESPTVSGFAVFSFYSKTKKGYELISSNGLLGLQILRGKGLGTPGCRSLVLAAAAIACCNRGSAFQDGCAMGFNC